MGDHDLAAKVAAYCETVESCDAVDVEHACERLGKADSAFVPSAGQVYSGAQENAATRHRMRSSGYPRLVTPEYSQDHRERMKQKFNALVEEIKSGVNIDGEYGKLQPGEKPRAHNAASQSRTTPSSWLERWEREHGRSYFPVYPRHAAE